MAKDCKTCSFESNCDDASRDMFGCAIRDRQRYLRFKDAETVCVDCIHQEFCPGKASITPGEACAGRAVKMASVIINDDYSLLDVVLSDARNQAASGKGKERHAVDGEPFERQQICEIGRRLRGNVAAGPLFQAVKKVYESGRLEGEAGVAELLGAINYISAAVILRREDAGKRLDAQDGRR